MTELVDAQEVFALGVPVKRRLTFSGTLRKNKAVVGARKDTWRQRPVSSLLTTVNGFAHNGLDTYVLMVGNQAYSSSDLLTLTLRTIPLAPFNTTATDVLYWQGYFYIASNYSSGSSFVLHRSGDKGVTWVTAPTPNPANSSYSTHMSVVNGILYMVASGVNTASFWNAANPAATPVARSFSRSATWSRVAGNASRQVSVATFSVTYIDVSTNGNSFAQDVAGEALMATLPNVTKYISNLGSNKVIIFTLSGSTGFNSIICDLATGAWSYGARIPSAIPGGVSGEIMHTYASAQQTAPNLFNDADGCLYIPFYTFDGARYRLRVISTFDGLELNFLPAVYDPGSGGTMTTGPNFVTSNIAGYPMVLNGISPVVEANPIATELVYEV